jgi:hypothetical protein
MNLDSLNAVPAQAGELTLRPSKHLAFPILPRLNKCTSPSNIALHAIQSTAKIHVNFSGLHRCDVWPINCVFAAFMIGYSAWRVMRLEEKSPAAFEQDEHPGMQMMRI